MNTTSFIIEEKDLDLAKNICKYIDDEDVRNRALANALIANISEKCFDTEQYKVDTISGIHNISYVLEDIEISDIYVNGNYIDVRPVFNDGKLYIPKQHFENDILPIAYLFIDVTNDISVANPLGFVRTEDVDKSIESGDYYVIDESLLLPFQDIISLLSHVYSDDVDDISMFKYFENTLEDKVDFYKKLIQSEESRLKFAQVAKAQTVFNFVSIDKACVSLNENAEEVSDIVEMDESSDILDISNVEDIDLMLDSSAETDLSMLHDDLEDNDLNLQDDNSVEFLNSIAEEEEMNSLDIIDENNDLEDFSLVEDNSAENDEQQAILDTELEDNLELEPESLSEQYDFTTVATPSLEMVDENPEELIENSIPEDKVLDNGLEELADISNGAADLTEEELEDIVAEDKEQSVVREQQENTEQIDTLFASQEEQSVSDERVELNEVPQKQNKKNLLLPVVVLLSLLSAGAYYGFTKFSSLPSMENDMQTKLPATNANNDGTDLSVAKKQSVKDAMPIETVEKVVVSNSKNEGNGIAIPAIEQNLDASILVANLKVDWEVPAGYASNTSAKRYFVKLGKIIQLNLKTELLLLSKPPITNKITVEIKYNNSSKKFETVNVLQSSGEASVDTIIKRTVDQALSMNLNANTDSFSKLQGNPILVIRL